MRSTKPPKGVQAPSPGQSDRRERHPGSDEAHTIRPEGAKAMAEVLLSLLLPLRGAFIMLRANPGCRSLRSLALGWKLIAPSGRALNAFFSDETECQRQLRGLFAYKRSTKPPKGVQAPSPGQSDRRERHPGSDEAHTIRPEGAKAMAEVLLSLLLPLRGAFIMLRADPGCRGYYTMSPVRAKPLFGCIKVPPLQGSSDVVRGNPGLHPGLWAKGRAFSPLRRTLVIPTWSAEAPSSCWRNRHRVCSRFASPNYLMPRRSRASA